MTSFHINPETGNPGSCRAKKGNCPFGGPAEHYATPALAREAFEEQMKAEISSMETVDILKTMSLKEMDAALLATTLHKEALRRGLNAELISTSIDIASILHAHQMRSNRAGFPKTPYIEHPLRNAVRLIRLGVRDEDLIIGAVLHDTIEDGSAVFVKKYLNKTPGTTAENRAKLAAFIEYKYGRRVREIVESVTNPLEVKPKDGVQLTIPEKLAAYRAHVVPQIKKSPEAYLVKVSDFMDNAGGLYHQDKPGNEGMMRKLSNKYLPLIEDFREHLPTIRHLVSEEGYSKIARDLDATETRLQGIIKKYGSY